MPAFPAVQEFLMKLHRHHASAALAAALVFCVAPSAGCMSSTYSVELPAPAPSAGTAPVVSGTSAHDIPALTQSVNWDKLPVAAVTEGF